MDSNGQVCNPLYKAAFAARCWSIIGARTVHASCRASPVPSLQTLLSRLWSALNRSPSAVIRAHGSFGQVSWLGLQLQPSSLIAVWTTIAMLLSAVLSPWMGVAADLTNHRKLFFVCWNTLGMRIVHASCYRHRPIALTRFINATCRGYQCRLVCDGGAFSVVVWWLAIHHRHLLVRSCPDVPILLPARG